MTEVLRIINATIEPRQTEQIFNEHKKLPKQSGAVLKAGYMVENSQRSLLIQADRTQWQQLNMPGSVGERNEIYKTNVKQMVSF